MNAVGRLSRTEALLLRELVECEGRVVSHERLLGVIGAREGLTPRQEYKRVAAVVSWLRGRFGADVIETVQGKGYRLSRRAQRAVAR